jgi:hypothetical protein
MRSSTERADQKVFPGEAVALNDVLSCDVSIGCSSGPERGS